MSTEADKNRGVFFLEIVHRYVATDHRVHLEFDTHVEDALHFCIKDVLRQSIVRNPVAQHAAGLGESLEHSDRIATPRQLIGARHAGRPGTDHRNLL